MKQLIIRLMCVLLFTGIAYEASAQAPQTTRRERQLINQGNKLYRDRKFAEASQRYQEALQMNPSSSVGFYNLGLSQIRQVTNPQDTTPKNKQLLQAARENLGKVAAMGREKPGLAAKANYNLGNLDFNMKEYQGAVNYYKQALRIDPNDNSARKNLRIAQKQLQNQNKDQNKNQNQNQNQDQNKDQNKDQQQQQQQQNQDQKQQDQQDKNISQQAANQILQAMDNKENQTRARVSRASKGDKSAAGGRSRHRW